MAGLPLGDPSLDLGQDLGAVAPAIRQRGLEQPDRLARLGWHPHMGARDALGRVQHVRIHLATELGDLLQDLLAGRSGHGRAEKSTGSPGTQGEGW
jgi:hypothetical protein